MENQETQRQVLGLLGERNELLEEVSRLKEELEQMAEQKEEEVESLKNMWNLKLLEVENEAGEGAKEVESKLLRSLDQERKRNAKSQKELSGKLQEAKKQITEMQAHEKTQLARFQQQNDQMAKLEGQLSEQAVSFAQERSSLVAQIENVKSLKEAAVLKERDLEKKLAIKNEEETKRKALADRDIKAKAMELRATQEELIAEKSEKGRLVQRMKEVEQKASEDVLVIKEDVSPLKSLIGQVEVQLREETKAKLKESRAKEVLEERVWELEEQERRVRNVLKNSLGVEQAASEQLDEALIKSIGKVEGLRTELGMRESELRIAERRLETETAIWRRKEALSAAKT